MREGESAREREKAIEERGREGEREERGREGERRDRFLRINQKWALKNCRQQDASGKKSARRMHTQLICLDFAHTHTQKPMKTVTYLVKGAHTQLQRGNLFAALVEPCGHRCLPMRRQRQRAAAERPDGLNIVKSKD